MKIPYGTRLAYLLSRLDRRMRVGSHIRTTWLRHSRLTEALKRYKMFENCKGGYKVGSQIVFFEGVPNETKN